MTGTTAENDDLRQEVAELRARQEELLQLLLKVTGYEGQSVRTEANKFISKSEHLDDWVLNQNVSAHRRPDKPPGSGRW